MGRHGGYGQEYPRQGGGWQQAPPQGQPGTVPYGSGQYQPGPQGYQQPGGPYAPPQQYPPPTAAQPPVPPPSGPERPRRRKHLRGILEAAAGLIALIIIISLAAAAGGKSSTVTVTKKVPVPGETQTVTRKVPVPGPTVSVTVTVTAPPPPQGSVIDTFTGTGNQVTPSFNVPADGNYIVGWTYSGNVDTSLGNDTAANFIITETGGGEADGLPNDIAASGSGSTEVTGAGSTDRLNVQATGSWTITIKSD